MDYYGLSRDNSVYYVKMSRNIELRREAIKKAIESSDSLLNACDLAKKFCCSKDTIKKDVKVLGLKINTGRVGRPPDGKST